MKDTGIDAAKPEISGSSCDSTKTQETIVTSYPCGGCKIPLPFKKGLCGACKVKRLKNFDKPSTQAMRNFLEKEAYRVTGFEVSDDSFWLYTESSEWCDDHGASGFRASSETAVIKYFYDRVVSRQEYDQFSATLKLRRGDD